MTCGKAYERLSSAPSATVEFATFLERLSFPLTPSGSGMRMNRLFESWRQPWTCWSPLYSLIEAAAKRRDFGGEASDPDKFYEGLRKLKCGLAAAVSVR